MLPKFCTAWNNLDHWYEDAPIVVRREEMQTKNIVYNPKVGLIRGLKILLLSDKVKRRQQAVEEERGKANRGSCTL